MRLDNGPQAEPSMPMSRNGWIRFLGSGHEKLSRNITDWNRSAHYLLVTNDLVGGFFVINGGGLGAYGWAGVRPSIIGYLLRRLTSLVGTAPKFG